MDAVSPGDHEIVIQTSKPLSKTIIAYICIYVFISYDPKIISA